MLPSSEAELLSIYFEETAKHTYLKNKEMSSDSSRSSKNEITDIELGDLEDEEEED